jgi:hypothetical protein
VLFGDFRNDDSFVATYYGGSGILLDAEGSNGRICLRECGGKIAASIDYAGQALVVFGGETVYMSYPGMVTFDGVDMMIQDWRSGNWSPSDGILMEHPANITLSYARFFVMLFVPAYNPTIPEFDLPVTALLACLALISAVRVRRKTDAPGSL